MSELTSKPVGAVAVISVDNPEPDTLIDCEVDAVPWLVLNAVNVPVLVIPPVTLPVAATFTLVNPVLLKTTFPEYDPITSADDNLTKTVVAESQPPV